MINFKFDTDGKGTEYTTMLKTCYPQEADGRGSLVIVSKQEGTVSGKPIVGIHFHSVIWDPATPEQRTTVPVMACVTAKELMMAVAALVVAHPSLKADFEEMFDMTIPEPPEDAIIEGSVNGADYVATAFVGYLVRVAGADQPALATDKESIEPTVQQVLNSLR